MSVIPPWRPSTRRYPVEYQSQADSMLQLVLKDVKRPSRRHTHEVEFQTCLDDIRKELKLIHNECVLQYLSELVTWNKYFPCQTFPGVLPAEQQDILDSLYHICPDTWYNMIKIGRPVKRCRTAVRLLQDAARRSDKDKHAAKRLDSQAVVNIKNPDRILAKQLAEVTNRDFKKPATQDQSSESFAESPNINPILDIADLTLAKPIDNSTTPELRHHSGLGISDALPSKPSITCWRSCWCCWCCRECCCKYEILPNSQDDSAGPLAETANIDTVPESKLVVPIVESATTKIPLPHVDKVEPYEHQSFKFDPDVENMLVQAGIISPGTLVVNPLPYSIPADGKYVHKPNVFGFQHLCWPGWDPKTQPCQVPLIILNARDLQRQGTVRIVRTARNWHNFRQSLMSKYEKLGLFKELPNYGQYLMELRAWTRYVNADPETFRGPDPRRPDYCVNCECEGHFWDVCWKACRWCDDETHLGPHCTSPPDQVLLMKKRQLIRYKKKLRKEAYNRNIEEKAKETKPQLPIWPAGTTFDERMEALHDRWRLD